MRIAIVGSGIAGLTAAYTLHRSHEVSVFEANDYIGGHTNTISVHDEAGSHAVDTGFIVFNERNYPNLCRLFEALDVRTRDSDMSFSVHCEKTGLEYNGTDVNGLFSQRRNLFNRDFWRMLKDIRRFHGHAIRELQGDLKDTITVQQFAREHAYSRQFIEYYLIPLGASLWSTPASKFRQFPIRFVLEFLNTHGMLQVSARPQWKTVAGGSSQYIKPLVKGFADNIYLKKAVVAVTRRHARVELTFADGSREIFDEVILATHADTSRLLLRQADAEEYTMLESFRYQNNDVVLHTDTSVLPDKRRTRASWNYRIPAREGSHVAVSYNMNMLQGLKTSETYCVSLNLAAQINRDKVIRRFQYQHPLFQPGRDVVQAQHQRLIRRRGISCCGAYWGYGFHEDGVSSALAVCAAFNMDFATA